jgi:putative transposase
MPRTARLVVPGIALHVTQRGHNRAPCFFKSADYALYLWLLARLAGEHACAVHAYCLMTNHVHLLLTPQAADGCAKLMKRLAQCYTQHVNKALSRSGSVWEGRFHSCLVPNERYALACYRYVELNPVSAGMVRHARDYRWSSYRANAEGSPDPLVAPHPAFPGTKAYRGLFDAELDARIVDDLRKATNGGFAAGSVRPRSGRRMADGRSTPGSVLSVSEMFERKPGRTNEPGESIDLASSGKALAAHQSAANNGT